MCIRFNRNYFVFNKMLEIHTSSTPKKSYCKMVISSSYTKPEGADRVYSDWIVIARGYAFNEALGLRKGNVFIAGGTINRTPYIDMGGKKKWPEPEITLFQLEKYVKAEDVTVTPPPINLNDLPF